MFDTLSDKLQATLGDLRSHGRLSEEQRQAAGIGQGLIRLAVGLEHVDDITDDLLRGLSTLTTR